MERKTCLFLILFALVCVHAHGQDNGSFYENFKSGNMIKWKHAMDSLEPRQKTTKDKLDLINFQHGYIAWCIDKDRIREAEEYIEKSEELIQHLEHEKYMLSALYAYKAALTGFKIGISPCKAPFIGPESLEYAHKSVNVDPSNAFGYVQLGNIAYYTPALFGGSRKEAMQYYLKALHLMESQNSMTIYDWNYLNLLATIINAYIELEHYQPAKHYCMKILSIEPDFDWVRNNLYPQVLKGLQNE